MNDELIRRKFDFVADAIDAMRSKISLIEWAYNNKIPIVSSFGAGNRFKPEDLYICDISEIENKNAPFISNILYQLRRKSIKSGITAVVSREKPFSVEKMNSIEKVRTKSGEDIEFTKIVPSSTPFVASTSGIFMAGFITGCFVKVEPC